MVKVNAYLSPHSSLPLPAAFQCENWTVGQVGEWLKGVDDGISAYLGHFIALGIDGKRLVNVDSDTLKRIGVNKKTTRVKIIAAINLLLYYSHSIKSENLQKLALETSLSSNELLNAVSQATPVIKNSSNVTKHIEMLNGVLRALTDTYEAAIRLIFWLERNPFVGNKKFVKLRNNLTALVDEMVDCVNNPNNPKFFSVPQVLVERAHSIRKICTEIIHMNDPIVLYTAFLERITIRRPPSSDWGFEVGRTCLGINLITRVDYNSPAAFSDKFDVGDEILEIDGTPVVGWKHSNLLAKLNEKLRVRPAQQFSTGNVDLQLLLCKRPRESGSPQRPPTTTTKMQQMVDNREQETEQMMTKMAWDFKNKIGTDLSKKWQRQQPAAQSSRGEGNSGGLDAQQHNHLGLRRARSSSFTVNTNASSRRCSECFSLPQTSRCIFLLMPTGKQPLFRRASVWNESPPAILRSPFEGFQSESNSWLLLLASWGSVNQPTPISERPERQQKPPPLKGIFGGHNVSVLVEEERMAEEENIGATLEPGGVIFASIEIVPEFELLKLGTLPTEAAMTPGIINIDGGEWSAPVREITGLQVQKLSTTTTFLDSGNNPTAIIIDSPLSNIHAKIARFFYGSESPGNQPIAPAPIAAPIQTPTAANLADSSAGQTTAQKLTFQRQLTNSECRTPITPNSKFSLDLPLSAASTKPGEESSSVGSIDSPSSYSTIVKTVVTRCRLAPLAEPDEIGDLTAAFMPEGAGKVEEEERKLSQLFRIPAQSHHHANVLIEGLIRRELLPQEQKRQRFRASFRRKRWTKCWALVREGILYVYPNQTSEEADVLVHLPFCQLARKPGFKTSKKHTFVLKSRSGGAKLHFATYTGEELNNWMAKIQSFMIGTGTTNNNKNDTDGKQQDGHESSESANSEPTAGWAMFIRQQQQEAANAGTDHNQLAPIAPLLGSSTSKCIDSA